MNRYSIKTARFNDIILLSFFPVVMIYMLLQFSGFRFPILGIYVRVALIYSAFVSFKYVSSNNAVYSFLILYILYCVVSFFMVTDSPIKTRGYFYDLLNYILPMLAFFIGSNNQSFDDRYYKWFLYSVLFCFILGLIFYFFSPKWYVQRISMIESEKIGMELSTLDQLHDKTRFSSFMYGSYPIQYFGIPALSFLLFQIYSSKNDRKITRLLYVISIIVVVISIILCQQRTAWGYLVVIFVFYLFVSFGKRNRIWSYTIVGILLLFIFSRSFSFEGVIEGSLNRRMEQMSFTGALSGRSEQYKSLWMNWTNYLFGHGMGSGGAIARVSGLPGASDAGYMKILYENGVAGSFLFLCVIIPTLFRIMRNRKVYYIEMHIVLFFLIAMIGSNALCISLYYGIIFWYAIGRVWNQKYFYNKINQM